MHVHLHLRMTGLRSGITALFLALALGACATLPSHTAAMRPDAAQAPLRFLLATAAATAPEDTLNPPLSAHGVAQADALAERLVHAPLVAVYATEFKRTRQTAQATLDRHPSLPLQAFFSRGPLEDTARTWRQRYTHGTVLAVGDPAQIAPLARALCGCPVEALEESQSARVLSVDFDAQGHASVQAPWPGEPER